MNTHDIAMSFELLFRKALGANSRSEFYGIDADYFTTLEGIYRGALIALTGHQVINPQKRDEIVSFLDDNSGEFSESETRIDQVDNSVLSNFYDDVKRIIEH